MAFKCENWHLYKHGHTCQCKYFDLTIDSLFNNHINGVKCPLDYLCLIKCSTIQCPDFELTNIENKELLFLDAPNAFYF